MHRNVQPRSFLMLFLAFLSAGIAHSATTAPPSDEQLISKVDALAGQLLEEPGGVGLSIAIVRGGDMVLASAYGLAEVEHGVSADADTMFRVGSVTKQFTAAAIMRLVEQGKLSLDDDITEYLPSFPTQGHTVTIRHLLTHTSGIKSHTGVKEFWLEGAARELTVDELLAYVKDLEFDFVPGEQYKYNNTGYYMLSTIVERVSGVPYCQFLQDEFFTPLGLSRIRCDSNTDVIPNRAQGYGLERGELINDALLDMNNVGGAGMIIANARDLVAWNMALMGGEVVSAESLQQMITPTILPNGESTGYGFGLNPGAFRGHRAIMHSGGIFGFTAQLVYLPDDDLYAAVHSNGAVRAQSVSRDIITIALGLDESLADLLPSAAEIKDFSGLYLLQNREFRLFEQDGYLFMQPTGEPPIRLLYQGQGEFRPSRDKTVKIIFDLENGQDFVLHQGGQQLRGVRQSLLDLTPTAEDITRFSGTYLLDRVEVEIVIMEQDGYLFIQPPGRTPARLIYQGQGEFRALDDPATKIIFDPEHGRDFVLHQGGGQVNGVRQPD